MSTETKDNRLIIYQPEEGVTSLEVKLENETVWLSLEQLSSLFQRNKSTISRHIKNIFIEKELTENSVVAFFATTASDGKTYSVEHFNLDVIISVGYRVKSKIGTQFRIWANKVLKNYLLNQNNLSCRIEKVEKHISTIQKEIKTINFQIKTEYSPKEGIFFDGHIFDAYAKAVSFIKEAESSIILIDNYIDETVFLMLSKRKKGVEVTIYTDKLTKELQLDLKKHNSQYEPIEIKIFKKSHDRFLIIDNKTVYHIGASLKDLGKRLFGFSKILIDPEIIVSYLEN